MTIIYTMLYASILLSSVALLLYISYVGLMWFIDRTFTYVALLQWIGFALLMALASGGVSYIVPYHWQAIISVITSHFTCMLAFHIFLFKIEEFLSSYCAYSLSSWLVYSLIGCVYTVLSLSAIIFSTMISEWFFNIGCIAIDYLTRTALLFSLLLEIKLRKHNTISNISLVENKYNEKEEYQNYDNQW